MSLWVVDASPLIFLAKLDRLPALERAADAILVPEAVVAEIQALRDAATSALEEAMHGWLVRVSGASAPEESTRGETAVIELALARDADRVVLDDSLARRRARARGLSVIGTIGILLAAKSRGDLPLVAPEIEKLQAMGFWVSRPLIQSALAKAGEG
jgi:predicted nucleic acid-binding protein